MHHFRNTRNTYNQHNKNDDGENIGCSFCYTMDKALRVFENDTMAVINNRVAYDMFESRRTTGEHLLIVPKRHVESFAEFTDQEKLDHMNVAALYEPKGFNVYSRGVGNISRSQPHQHTHLIKLVNKRPKLHVFTAKPYFVLHID